ncbi:amino acid adenylation domain-containing protein [Streptomyces sp. NPDC003077]|uniref:amino acid adenylation domain-containing protein n=1 Tax=Streptomyces sp. NPDC003077 TaxID=3154443 RepID=UPI0033B0F947
MNDGGIGNAGDVGSADAFGNAGGIGSDGGAGNAQDERRAPPDGEEPKRKVSLSLSGALLDVDAFPELPLTARERDRAAALALRGAEPAQGAAPAAATTPASVPLPGRDLSVPVVAWVRRHAAADPDRPAVRDDQGPLSYADLLDRAGRLAALLDGAGAGGELVAVAAPRGADVLAAFLACELVDAVYLPLDHLWPELRLRDVLRRADPAVVLTSDAQRTGSPVARAANALGCPLRTWSDAAGFPAGTDDRPGTPAPVPSALAPVAPAAGHPETGTRRPTAPTTPHHPRYVIYTSGSTGAPKGAVIEQGGMLNHLWAKIEDLALTRADRVAQTAPLAFDISVWQMLAPLVVGGVAEVFPDDVSRDPVRLAEELARREITVAETVPTLLQLMAEELTGTAPRLPSLRWMLATGEELSPATARRWLAAVPTCRLMNAYGPTECSDDVTHHIVRPEDTTGLRLPIGSPVAHTTLYVLARDGEGWRACEPGEPGELFVGGAGVGRGYLRDPERTRDAFFRDPFTPDRRDPLTSDDRDPFAVDGRDPFAVDGRGPSTSDDRHPAAPSGHGRLYRTGDRARRTPDDGLEYLGRVDRQVKIGGVRVELGEIEAVVRAHPAVTACAVRVWRPGGEAMLIGRETALTGESPAPRIVAYVCGDAARPLPAELTAHCARRLPAAMVPGAFVTLPEIPVNQNGKVAYEALPAPEAASDRQPYNAPVDAPERAVAAAMAGALRLREVGRDESFVRLGGDSLRGMRVAAHLRAAGYRVALRDILIGQTPRDIAPLLTPATPPVRAEAPPAPAPGAVRRHAMTPYQRHLYASWERSPDNPAFGYQGTLRLTGPLDTGRLARAWQALLAESPVLTARWYAEGGRYTHDFPVWDIPLPPPVDLTRTSRAHREDTYRQAALTAATTPFSLPDAPAVRVALYRTGRDEHRLLLTLHEIVLDGWGVTLLVERFARLYGEPATAPDPARALRYDGYLAWQRAALADPARRAAWRHWEQVFADPPTGAFSESARTDEPGTADDPGATDEPGSTNEPIATDEPEATNDPGPTNEPMAAALVPDEPPPPPQPTNHPPTPLPAHHRSTTLERLLTADRLREARTLGARQGLTPFMIVLGAYALALRPVMGADSFFVHAPIANREHPEQSDVPAFLLNFLPLRVSCRPGDTTLRYLQRLRGEVAEAYSAADCPTDWMARGGPAPPAEAVLNFLTHPARRVTAGGVDFAYTVLDHGFTKAPCVLYAQEHDAGGLLLQLVHRRNAMAAPTARGVADRTMAAFDLLLDHPEGALDDLITPPLPGPTGTAPPV